MKTLEQVVEATRGYNRKSAHLGSKQLTGLERYAASRPTVHNDAAEIVVVSIPDLRLNDSFVKDEEAVGEGSTIAQPDSTEPAVVKTAAKSSGTHMDRMVIELPDDYDLANDDSLGELEHTHELPGISDPSEGAHEFDVSHEVLGPAAFDALSGSSALLADSISEPEEDGTNDTSVKLDPKTPSRAKPIESKLASAPQDDSLAVAAEEFADGLEENGSELLSSEIVETDSMTSPSCNEDQCDPDRSNSSNEPSVSDRMTLASTPSRFGASIKPTRAISIDADVDVTTASDDAAADVPSTQDETSETDADVASGWTHAEQPQASQIARRLLDSASIRQARTLLFVASGPLSQFRPAVEDIVLELTALTETRGTLTAVSTTSHQVEAWPKRASTAESQPQRTWRHLAAGLRVKQVGQVSVVDLLLEGDLMDANETELEDAFQQHSQAGSLSVWLANVNDSHLSDYLTAACDATIMLVDLNESGVEACRLAVTHLRDHGARLLGTVVLNDTKGESAWAKS